MGTYQLIQRQIKLFPGNYSYQPILTYKQKTHRSLVYQSYQVSFYSQYCIMLTLQLNNQSKNLYQHLKTYITSIKTNGTIQDSQTCISLLKKVITQILIKTQRYDDYVGNSSYQTQSLSRPRTWIFLNQSQLDRVGRSQLSNYQHYFFLFLVIKDLLLGGSYPAANRSFNTRDTTKGGKGPGVSWVPVDIYCYPPPGA